MTQTGLLVREFVACVTWSKILKYHMIRSFITYRGVFMGPGYDLGDVSIWRELSTYDRDDDYRW